MKQFLLLVLSTTLCMSTIHAQNPLRKTQFNVEKSLVIKGYDPVAYFTQNKAVKGNKQFSANEDGLFIIIHLLQIKLKEDLPMKSCGIEVVPQLICGIACL